MIETGKQYRANVDNSKLKNSMPWSSCILTIDEIHGEPENPNTKISFTASNGKKDSCRVNWLEGFWVEATA